MRISFDYTTPVFQGLVSLYSRVQFPCLSSVQFPCILEFSFQLFSRVQFPCILEFSFPVFQSLVFLYSRVQFPCILECSFPVSQSLVSLYSVDFQFSCILGLFSLYFRLLQFPCIYRVQFPCIHGRTQEFSIGGGGFIFFWSGGLSTLRPKKQVEPLRFQGDQRTCISGDSVF